MATTVTLMNLSCPNNCRHCSYGTYSPVPYADLSEMCRALMGRGYRVHFYDMLVTHDTLEIFRTTRQFETENPGWLNLTHDFEPSESELAYLNGSRLAVVLSLHGSDPATHAMLARDANEHDAVVAAIRRWRQVLRIPLGLNYVVHRQNVDDVPHMIRFAQQHLGVDFVEFINLGYGGNSLTALSPEFALDQASFLRAYGHLRSAKARLSRFVQLDAQWGPDFAGVAPVACHIFAEPIAGHFCNAGLNHFALRADLRGVWPCPTLVTAPEARVGTYVAGTLQIERAWSVAREDMAAPCHTCDRWHLCRGGCRSIAVSDTLSQTGCRNLRAGFIHCLYVAYQQGRLRHVAASSRHR